MSVPDYDFLNEEAPADVVPEQVTPEAPTAPVEPAAVAAPAAPTAADPVEPKFVPLAALEAERKKRQERDQRIAELERARQPQAAPAPQFYEAPEQYVQHVASQVQQQTTQVLYAALREAAREQYADYDEVFAEVLEAAKVNPLIEPQVMSAGNPALAAYKLGKQLRQMKELQDPAAYRAKVEAEVRAQIKAEQDAAAAAKAAQVAAIPPDLSAARSARDEPVAEDDDSLEAILATRKRR